MFFDAFRYVAYRVDDSKKIQRAGVPNIIARSTQPFVTPRRSIHIYLPTICWLYNTVVWCRYDTRSRGVSKIVLKHNAKGYEPRRWHPATVRHTNTTDAPTTILVLLTSVQGTWGFNLQHVSSVQTTTTVLMYVVITWNVSHIIVMTPARGRIPHDSKSVTPQNRPTFIQSVTSVKSNASYSNPRHMTHLTPPYGLPLANCGEELLLLHVRSINLWIANNNQQSLILFQTRWQRCTTH